jgi:hypothetical protein
VTSLTTLSMTTRCCLVRVVTLRFGWLTSSSLQPPPLSMVHEFVGDAYNWLTAHPDNVIAVHCKAGKGRTGTMICCLLLFLVQLLSLKLVALPSSRSPTFVAGVTKILTAGGLQSNRTCSHGRAALVRRQTHDEPQGHHSAEPAKVPPAPHLTGYYLCFSFMQAFVPPSTTLLTHACVSGRFVNYFYSTLQCPTRHLEYSVQVHIQEIR